MERRQWQGACTGGASGMGEATCHELGRRGLKVAVLDVNEQAAQRVTEDLRAAGITAIGVGADVTDRAAVEQAFAKVRSELGPVSVLVTSAGHVRAFPRSPRSPSSPGRRIIDVNLTGTFHCCQVALPDMVAAKWGRIVMISSSSAQRGSPFAAHYAASKGAVITLTKSLAREYAAHGITVNNIPPSGIETPMQHQGAGGGIPAVQRADRQQHPVGPSGYRSRHRRGGRVPLLRRGRLHHRPGTGRQRRSGDVTGRANVRTHA